MKPLMHIFLLTLLSLSSVSAHAGPSDGGGTNVSENELVEFAKFQSEFGGKQFSIEPRAFKLPKSDTPVYEEIKAKLNHMEEVVPGSLPSLEGAFNKPWVVIDANITGRKNGEQKVISQTDTTVFVSLPWLKKASPEQVRRAFTHEAVRSFASELARARFMYKFDHRDEDDQVTELLTPLVYNDTLPSQLLEDAMKKTQAIHRAGTEAKMPNVIAYVTAFQAASRKELYNDLNRLGVDKIKQICNQDNTVGFWANRRMETALEPFRKDRSVSDELNHKYHPDSNVATKSLDPSAQALVDLMLAANDGGTKAYEVGKLCRQGGYEQFLKRLEAERGQSIDKAKKLDRLPDDVLEEKESEHDAN